MTTLLVRGLDDEGPGDIVGAFVDEAGVSPDAIGEIDVNGGEATVEVEASAADRVAERMDGGRVGTSSVRVDPLEDDLEGRDVAVASAASDPDAAVDAVEVDTVDGFQGREKELVLVSLVRSNDRDEVGFLDEPRRFNVPVTRARRKLVVVGDVDTVSAADVYREFAEYAAERGRIVRA